MPKLELPASKACALSIDAARTSSRTVLLEKPSTLSACLNSTPHIRGTLPARAATRTGGSHRACQWHRHTRAAGRWATDARCSRCAAPGPRRRARRSPQRRLGKGECEHEPRALLEILLYQQSPRRACLLSQPTSVAERRQGVLLPPRLFVRQGQPQPGGKSGGCTAGGTAAAERVDPHCTPVCFQLLTCPRAAAHPALGGWHGPGPPARNIEARCPAGCPPPSPRSRFPAPSAAWPAPPPRVSLRAGCGTCGISTLAEASPERKARPAGTKQPPRNHLDPLYRTPWYGDPT